MANRIERVKPYEAKKALTALLHKVAYRRIPVVLESRGKDLAAIVPMEFLAQVLRGLPSADEDEFDLKAIQDALSDPSNARRIPWSDARDELDRHHKIVPTVRRRTYARRKS